MKPNKPLSLAEQVVRSAVNSSLRAKLNFRNIDDILLREERGVLTVRRFQYDKSAGELIARLREIIPVVDFGSQFSKIVMPFDYLWLEGKQSEATINSSTSRIGFLLVKEIDKIRARYFIEANIPKYSASGAKLTPLQIRKKLPGAYVYDDKYVMPGLSDIVLDESGINIVQTDVFKKMFSGNNSQFAQKQIELDTTISEDIFRFLLLLSSKYVSTNILENSRSPNIANHGKSRSRQANDGTRPISINLLAALSTALKSDDKNKVRELLGWTSVCRHERTYHTKQGPVRKTIKPHDRRIPADVDRRNAARELTSQQLATIASRPEKQRVLGRKKPDTNECA